MRIPESLVTLADYGIIEEVVRPLMSGKEAQIYLVIAGGEQRVAKIYKEAENRSFKHRAEYTEGRKVRNTRDQRAISKRSSHGRAQDEAAWRAAEVNIIYRLQEAGVRVPVPYHFIDGVLVMELITDAEGNPAPRLGDLALSSEAATVVYDQLIRTVVRMLCAGVVHGDLSDFNVLMAAEGPVIIDFPQAVDPAHNQNARKLLLRDVNNLHDFLARFVRNARRLPFAEEMWELYQSNLLAPDTVLAGRYKPSNQRADTASVMALIDDARRDEARRRETFGRPALKGVAPLAVVPGPTESTSQRGQPEATGPRDERGSQRRGWSQAKPAGQSANTPVANTPRGNPPAANTPRGNPQPQNTPRGNPPVSNAPRGNPPAANTPRGNPPVKNSPRGNPPVANTPRVNPSAANAVPGNPTPGSGRRRSRRRKRHTTPS